MADGERSRERYGEAFWRAHHEAWRQSDLNQREYCEAHGLSLKAFGNWRAKFKAESQPPPRKLLYRRGGLSHRLIPKLADSDSCCRRFYQDIHCKNIQTSNGILAPRSAQTMAPMSQHLRRLVLAVRKGAR